VARTTLRRILADHGIDPVGRRSVTWRGLVRYFVLFVIDLKTRRIAITGISPAHNGAG